MNRVSITGEVLSLLTHKRPRNTVSRVEENTGTLIERSGQMQNNLASLEATMTSVASASRVTDDRKTVLLFAPEHTDSS